MSTIVVVKMFLQTRGLGSQTPVAVRPNVRVKLRATAGSVSLVREDVRSTADQAYAACRSVSA
jgi:hypothetical protein